MNTASLPMVSILIPCYNAQQWVKQAIESALAQTWPNKEVIVVDDGSTDESLSVVRSFGDAIRVETGPNQGGNVARNRLLELSSGEWLQYLDADDYLLPTKVEQQLLELSSGGPVDLAFSPVIMEYVMPDGTSSQQLQPIPEPHDDPWVLLALWQLPQTGAPLWRRQAIIDVGGWKSDQPCCQEHELYLRLMMGGKSFQYCPTPGAVYRQWSEQTVCKKNKPEVHRRRLDIEQRAEDWLRDRHQLTPLRLRAINQARFETARSVWQYDSVAATKIMKSVRASDASFVPGGNAAPRSYRAMYRLLGFSYTERVARWTRDARVGKRI